MSDAEKREYLAVDPNNRANVVVWKMQSIVEHHRRAGNISERGAFDIYHDLEACLEAYKHMERIVSTKMPFQYLHMVNFLLFIFVFSAPFVFTTGFKWLSPIPSCIVAIAFYGVAEVARSIEDPYSWVKPCHDLSGVGWGSTRDPQLHEMSVAELTRGRGGRAKEKRASVRQPTAGKKTGSRQLETASRRRTTGSIGAAEPNRSRPSPAVPRTSRSPRRRCRGRRSSRRPPARRREGSRRIAIESGGRTPARFERVPGSTSATSVPPAAPGWRRGGPRSGGPELSDRLGFFRACSASAIRRGFPAGGARVRRRWFAQLAKLYRCGGTSGVRVRDFEPHAHALSARPAFMIVYRFKDGYDRYWRQDRDRSCTAACATSTSTRARSCAGRRGHSLVRRWRRRRPGRPLRPPRPRRAVFLGTRLARGARRLRTIRLRPPKPVGAPSRAHGAPAPEGSVRIPRHPSGARLGYPERESRGLGLLARVRGPPGWDVVSRRRRTRGVGDSLSRPNVA